MANGGQQSGDVLSGVVGLGLLLWVGSCVFGGGAESKPEATQQVVQDQQAAKSRNAASGAARFGDDPLIAQGNRMSPNGDGFAYAISALGQQCAQTVSVTPLKRPMLYNVICSNGSTGGRLNFVKYRLDTAAGISELLS